MESEEGEKMVENSNKIEGFFSLIDLLNLLTRVKMTYDFYSLSHKKVFSNLLSTMIFVTNSVRVPPKLGLK